MNARFWLIAIAGAVVGAAGFVVTLLWTEPGESKKAGISALASSPVSDAGTLKSAAQAAGLRMSDDIKGHVAATAGPSTDQVKLSGWAADIYGDGTPLTVIAFLGGKSKLQVRTRDRNDEVAKFLKISPNSSAVRNVMYEGIVSCSPGDTMVVVAVSQHNDYYSWLLPGCRKP